MQTIKPIFIVIITLFSQLLIAASVDLRNWDFEIKGQYFLSPEDFTTTEDGWYQVRVKVDNIVTPLVFSNDFKVPYLGKFNGEIVLNPMLTDQFIYLPYPQQHPWGNGYEFQIKFTQPGFGGDLSQVSIASIFDADWNRQRVIHNLIVFGFLGFFLFYLLHAYFNFAQRANLMVALMGLSGYFVAVKYIRPSLLLHLLSMILPFNMAWFLDQWLPALTFIIFAYAFMRTRHFFSNFSKAEWLRFFKSDITWLIYVFWGIAIILILISFFTTGPYTCFYLRSAAMFSLISGSSFYHLSMNAKKLKEVKAHTEELKAAIKVTDQRNKGLEKDIINRTRDINEQTQLMDIVLKEMSRGILLIESNLEISQCSAAFKKMFSRHKEIVGRNLIELLSEDLIITEDTKNQWINGLDFMMGEDILGFETNDHVLPTTLNYSFGKNFSLSWHAMTNKNDEVTSLLVVFQDQDEELSENSDQFSIDLRRFQEMASVGIDKISSFMESTETMLNQIKVEGIKSGADIPTLFRLMHTIKGNARTFHLTDIMEQTHLAESYLSEVRDGNQLWNQQVFATNLGQVYAIVREYHQLFKQYFGGSQDPNRIMAKKLAECENLLRQYQKNQISFTDLKNSVEGLT